MDDALNMYQHLWYGVALNDLDACTVELSVKSLGVEVMGPNCTLGECPSWDQIVLWVNARHGAKLYFG